MERIDIQGGRYYKTEHGLVPSVTTILGVLSTGLDTWLMKQAVTYAVANYNRPVSRKTLIDNSMRALSNAGARAAAVGTVVHDAIQSASSGNPGHDTEQGRAAVDMAYPAADQDVSRAEARQAFQSWQFFLEETGAKVIDNEVAVIGETDWGYYAGTRDGIIEMPDGTRILFDVKTGWRVRSSYALQTAAYAKALEQAGTVLDEVWVLRCDKRYRHYEIHPVNYDTAWQLFEAAHGLFIHLNDNVWEQGWAT